MAPSESSDIDGVDDGSVEPFELNAVAIVSVLNRHRVDYVVIGAFAAIAQQAPIAPTRDIDVTPDDSTDNLGRLSDALKELDARIRTGADDGGVAFDHDVRRADMWNLICRYGEFDISFRPAGFDSGYAALIRRAHRVLVDGVQIPLRTSMMSFARRSWRGGRRTSACCQRCIGIKSIAGRWGGADSRPVGRPESITTG